jgi:Carboxypeptidase regulatory-like domain
MRVAVVGAFALVAVAAASALPSRSGLHGYVTRGPVTPVCYEHTPCDVPVPDATVVFKRADGVVVRARTNPKGFYRAVLPPGQYAVTFSANARARFGYGPRKVRALAGRDGRVDFHIDSGIQ